MLWEWKGFDQVLFARVMVNLSIISVKMAGVQTGFCKGFRPPKTKGWNLGDFSFFLAFPNFSLTLVKLSWQLVVPKLWSINFWSYVVLKWGSSGILWDCKNYPTFLQFSNGLTSSFKVLFCFHWLLIYLYVSGYPVEAVPKTLHHRGKVSPPPTQKNRLQLVNCTYQFPHLMIYLHYNLHQFQHHTRRKREQNKVN